MCPGYVEVEVLAGVRWEAPSSFDVFVRERHRALLRFAYVLSGDWSDRSGGSPYLIDAKGNANAMVGLGAADLLGYAGYDAPVVPDAWIELFDEGVPLSQDAALCPPDPVVGRTCD